MKKKVIIFIVIAVVILAGVAIWYFYFRNNTAPAPAPAPYTPVSNLPSCASVQKQCRSNCINKWWIPVIGITEYQKCMDKCYVNNPCI